MTEQPIEITGKPEPGIEVKGVIHQKMLGLDPYILVLFGKDNGDPTAMAVNLEWGGGVTSEMVRDLLLDVAESMPETAPAADEKASNG